MTRECTRAKLLHPPHIWSTISPSQHYNTDTVAHTKTNCRTRIRRLHDHHTSTRPSHYHTSTLSSHHHKAITPPQYRHTSTRFVHTTHMTTTLPHNYRTPPHDHHTATRPSHHHTTITHHTIGSHLHTTITTQARSGGTGGGHAIVAEISCRRSQQVHAQSSGRCVVGWLVGWSVPVCLSPVVL